MDVPTPHPPAASRSFVCSLAAALSFILPLTGCYEGAKDSGGVPWYGDDDSDGGEGGTGDDGATDDADDRDAPADDGGGAPTDDGDDGVADDGAADEDTADGGAADDGATDDGAADDGATDGSNDGGDPPASDVPDNAYCSEVAAWDPQWAQLELDILAIVNEVRAEGANCGSEGSFGPTGPLSMNSALRCAARKHSKDMNDRAFFDHTNPSGESPWDRMGQAGYSYSAAGENIAGGSPDAAGTMQQWMTSDGHCSNIMNPGFEEIGVGYYPGGQWGTLWTQAFGSP